MKTVELSDDVVWEKPVPRNSGLAFEMQRGQRVRVSAPCVVDLVAFNRADLRERFDQARTKANQRKIFLSTGDHLLSKLNNILMTITDDQFLNGHHDLQSGGCSRRRFEIAAAHDDLEKTYGRAISRHEIPTHGCWENLSAALLPWGIASEDVPSPFNIFQDMVIDGITGSMNHSAVRATDGTHVELRAELDLLVALSICPDMIAGGARGGLIKLLRPTES